ncbi:MAG TPA: Trk system potassium transporter TrkA, partial [Tepidisphaeraceae bacterium]|nr:Trk system potassium transporter TrkA [Tepidisphaeraceae bacterium]
EQSQEKIDRIRRKLLDVMTVVGNGANPSVLEEAGARNADLVVAATDADEVNMVACFAAKQMGAKRTVARLRREEYATNGGAVTFSALGIDHVVTPELVAADEIADVLSSGAAIAVEDFGAGKIRMTEYKISGCPIVGIPLQRVSFPRPCKVVAIVRPEGCIIPHGEDTIRPGDHVYLMANRDHLRDLEPLFGVAKGKGAARKITIFGGGRIGFQLARMLERHNVGVKVIEQNRERCELLAAELNGSRVICGDERDLDVFREEAVPGADAFVAITARGELNILTALLAKQMGVARAIAVFNEPEYMPLAEKAGIDAAISPLLLSAGAILKLVRRGQVMSVALLEQQQAEALELVASAGSRVVGPTLAELGFPRGATIGAILRSGKAIVPDGQSRLLAGDRAVVVALPSAMPTVERLFASS